MEIQVKNNILLIKSESLFEEKILNSEYFQSKLAYRITDKLEEEKKFKITFNGDVFFIDKKNNIANIGDKNLTEGRLFYMLRMIVDRYIVCNEGIGLHSGLAYGKGKAFFLIGDTKSGKSFYVKKLKENNIEVLGDDHTIILNNCMMGNLKSRVRDNEGEHYENNSPNIKYLNNYLVFDINISGKKEISEISFENYVKILDFKPVLKYLYCGIETESQDIKIDSEIIENYRKRYLNFLKNAEKIIKINGNYFEDNKRCDIWKLIQ